MTDNMKQFLETISKDQEFIEKFNQAPDTESILTLAKEKGFILTEEDLKPDAGIQMVPDDEIDAVAGGKECFCFAGGGGEASEDYEETCACVGVGIGLIINSSNMKDTRCLCAAAGYGDDSKL